MHATAHAIPSRGHVTLAETAADSRVMATRQLRKVLRRPMYVVYLFVQPVIFVLLFRYVFGGAISTPHVSYVNYLMPGIIVMTAIFGALTTGLGLTEDLKAGVVDRFRSLPIARSAVLIGRTAADLVGERATPDRDAARSASRSASGRPSPSMRWRRRSRSCWRSHTCSRGSARTSGLAVRDPETAQSVGFIWVFPLVFASSAFVPTSSMPGALHAFADVNPVSLTVNAARALTVGHGHALGARARDTRVARWTAAGVRPARSQEIPPGLSDETGGANWSNRYDRSRSKASTRPSSDVLAPVRRTAGAGLRGG